MKLIFLGADHEVTGSCHLLQVNGKNILIDCGMEQGEDIYENAEMPISPNEVDFVLLTHAHIDHSGKIPLLVKNGFCGPVYMTSASADLCDIMLRDSAHIQEFEAQWRNRKAARSGQEPYIPLYTTQDAIDSIKLFVPCEYNQNVTICEGVEIRFADAGHLLGSSSIEITATENGVTKKIVFSGDIGNVNQPIIKDPTYLETADYVIMESTYGDRSHGEVPDYVSEISKIIQETFDRGGNVVIPSFAVGRTQEMLYFLRKIKDEGRIVGHDNFSVYVDSPLANEATNVFNKNIYKCFDADTMAMINQGINPLSFNGLCTAVTAEESRMINFDTAPKIIISASGMCEAGRIRHHLKHNLWREECTVVFVGYQANGTLGRHILEGATSVKLFGETVEVNARICRLNGVSGHADDKGLMKWISSFKNAPERVFVVHGEDSVCDTFSARIKNELDLNVTAPYSGDSWDLILNEQIEEGSRKRIPKKDKPTGRAIEVFERLLNAGNRLMAIIRSWKGAPNKDIARFAEDIKRLCDKYENR